MKLSSYVLDNGLQAIDALADKIYICSQEPTTYAEATTTGSYALGVNDFGSAGGAINGTITDASPNGRKVTTNAITAGTVLQTGTVTSWAVVDSANSRLLATGAITSFALTSGLFAMNAFVIAEPAFGSGYAGPGDVVSSAVAWWGLRAYTLASIGNNAIRLRRDSDNIESDFATVSGGGLDLGGISSFKGGANLFVTKLYDQSGNGRDIVQTTAANQPSFTLSGLNGFPIITFVRASATQLLTASAFTINQPYSLSNVAKNAGSTSGTVFSARTVGNQGQFGFDTPANNQVYIYAGGPAPVVSASNGGYHAFGAVFNVASSQIVVDGTSTGVDVASGSNVSDAIGLGIDVSGGTGGLDGQIQEFGAWTGILTGTQFTNLSSNQRTYWGFSPSGYTGPGDIVAGATGWWGLRAYSAARIGSRAIRLRRSSDNAEQDFVTLTNGLLDTTAITAWAGSSSLFVSKLYDQSGNGRDLVQATAVNQPSFLLSNLGAFPSLNFIAPGLSLAHASGFSQSQPFTLCGVSYYVNNSLQSTVIGGVSAGSRQLGYNLSGSNANKVFIYAGSATPQASATDGGFHSVIGIYDDAVSSAIVIDGTSTSATLGSIAGFALDALRLGVDTVGGAASFNGYVQEFGLWPSAFSGSTQTAINTNQHTYWGFSPSGYTGPGDVVGSATSWWGLRAYSAARIGSRAIRLRRSSDNAEQDFVTVTGGGVDLTAISAFKGASSVFVTKLYDQVGTAHWVQATAANQPEFKLNVIGSKPSIAFVRTNNTFLTVAAAFAQPYSVNGVAERTGTGFSSIMASPSGGVEVDFNSSVNSITLFATSQISLSGVNDNSFHALSFIGNGASSFLAADGTTGGTANAGSATMTSPLTFGAFSSSTQVLDGFISELGVWPVAFSGSDCSNLSTNQHAYWGF